MITFQLVAMTLSLAAAPAAPDPRPAASPSAASAPAAAAEAQPAKLDRKRYCVVDTITGSRLPRRQCRTRAEWLNLGFDPLADK